MVDEHVRQVGRYRIVREIGRGGMAAVYLARQVDLDRDVALKELNSFHAADPAFAERFVRESRVAGSMQHPNIVTVFEFLTEGGTPYIAMEYLERGSLRPFVGHTTLAQTIGVLEGALAGLAQAERRGVVHRDIKPENLMVTADGEVKIADFGIAKALSEVGGPNLTATGTTVGTPAYMAPEQATAGEIGPWTDLYSVGITAYEMAVSRVPFHDSTTPVAVLMRQVSEEIPSAVSVDPAVDRRFSDWIDRLLVKDAAARTQSARQAWYELEEIAVAALGPLWRREARLLVSGTDRAAGPLTPAPFERDTPPPHDAGYETYLGDAPAAPPPAPPPPPRAPAETLRGQPLAPAPAAAAQQATVAPASAAGAPPANETFQWPTTGGARRRLLIPAAIVLIVALAAGAYLFTQRGGSSKPASTQRSGGGKPPASLPTVTPVPANFEPGELQSVAGLGTTAWALKLNIPKRVVELGVSQAQRDRTAIHVGRGATSLASGDDALWVSETTPTGGKLLQIVPGPNPVRKTIPFPSHPAGVRVIVDAGTIWIPVADGLLKVPETGGTAVRVQGVAFRPDSLELVDGAIWASDGKTGQLAKVPTAGTTATVVPVAGMTNAGWLAGSATELYVTTATGVTMIDPANPATQSPLAAVTTPPVRITVVGTILWAASYSAPTGKTRNGTLEGFDLTHPGKHTIPVPFTAPSAHIYITKLVDVSNTFWLTVVRPGGVSGLEPFTLSG